MANDSFFEQVHQVVRLIPYGRICSYGVIANYLGSKGAARMVGWAMNKSHLREGVPAHRVVNKTGLLTGKRHFGGSNVMKELLESEGIPFDGDQILDFDRFFWDPGIELKPD
jgi:methylated-DNA-protein-cysteine methyltransferase related protein